MNSKVLRRVLLAAFSTIFFAQGASCLTIDEFNGDDSVESTTTGLASSHAVANASAIGNSRTLTTTQQAGPAGVRLKTLAGALYHSQDALTKGRSVVTWDGNINAANVDFTGLGGVSLVQDGGDSILLDVISMDLSPASLTIYIYDKSDGSGLKYSTLTQVLAAPILVGSGTTISFPFSSLVPGPGGLADLSNVGAIQLVIDGSTADLDLALEKIRTNGKCTQVPDSAGKVIDECGVCGGDNKSCADCKGIPNGPNKLDACGVCAGDNSSCSDCAGVPHGTAVLDKCGVCNGGNKDIDSCGVCFGGNKDLDDCGICSGNNLSKDQCGVCGGDNSKCADCKGVPNGTDKVDACGVCAGDGKSCADCLGVPYGVAKLDRCGVCGGDGTACVQCKETDLTKLRKTMNQKSLEQLRANIKALEGINIPRSGAGASEARSFIAGLIKESKRLYRDLQARIAAIPKKALKCTDSLVCKDSAAHVASVQSYQQDVRSMYEISKKIVHRLNHQLNGGVCNGTGYCPPTSNASIVKELPGSGFSASSASAVDDCQSRTELRKLQVKKLRQQLSRLFKQNLLLTKKVPLTISVCD